MFFDKKYRHIVVKLVENIVLRAHYMNAPITNKQNREEQLELLNTIKLLLVDLVNEHVEDMIRVIRQMNEKNK